MQLYLWPYIVHWCCCEMKTFLILLSRSILFKSSESLSFTVVHFCSSQKAQTWQGLLAQLTVVKWAIACKTVKSAATWTLNAHLFTLLPYWYLEQPKRTREKHLSNPSVIFIKIFITCIYNWKITLLLWHIIKLLMLCQICLKLAC